MNKRKDVLIYKDYIGSIETDVEADLLHGTVHGIQDVIHYEGHTLRELEAAFRESVDDYLAMCEQAGEQPEKPYSGKFQVRVGAALHRQAASLAAAEGISMNDLIQRALEKEVASASDTAGNRARVA